jgi:nicotinate-nucleotide adenylyltransferase
MKTNLIPKNAKRVGLLGGSFNPAHAGHRHISLQVMKSLGLDCIIWLVSPQNPLKSLNVRNTLESRVKYAITLADHPNIIVSDIEKEFANSYTITTVKELAKKFPKVDFVWIMGADNMVQFPKWQNWQEILDIMPVCVYDRTGYTKAALQGKVAKEYKGKIIKRSYKGDLKACKWYFMMMKKIDISSSAIRCAVGE